MPKIFISYRREDSRYPSGEIANRLRAAFGKESIVLDVDNIPPGQDFREYVKRQLDSCDYLLAVIGKSWLTICDENGRPKLENSNDWVRLELETALGRGSKIPVIPVLLDNVPAPSEKQLPDSLKELAYRQAHSVRPPTDFDHDVEQLIRKIKQAQTDAPKRALAIPLKSADWPRRGAILGSAAALVVVAFVLMLIAFARKREGPRPDAAPNPPQVQTPVEPAPAASTGVAARPIGINDVAKEQTASKEGAPSAGQTVASAPPALSAVAGDSLREPVVVTAGGQFLINSVGMKLALIPAGEFLMGAPNGEKESTSDEKPQHRVQITKPFYCGIYEVTQAEFERVMGRNPSAYSAHGENREKVAGLDTSRFPVENISWCDAAEFCNKLSEREKRRPYYQINNLVRRDDGSVKEALVTPQEGDGYRLPTEAEWEYACRAGTTTPFYFGSSLDGSQANCDGTKPYGTDQKQSNLMRPTTVGSYAPNKFGLFDMHGNVWEWCWDWYDVDYYKKSPKTDPAGSTDKSTGTMEVMRGGCWYTGAVSVRAAYRGHDDAAIRYGDTGLRVVSTLSPVAGSTSR